LKSVLVLIEVKPAKQSKPSMTDLEYVQNMPATHLLLQRQVNKQLWHQWNLADHKRAVDGNGWAYYTPEESIYSAAVEPQYAVGQGPPPALSLCYTICSRRWIQEQERYMDARIGDIFFAKNGTGSWDTSGVRVTYALERVDEPRRWNKYCVHHLSSERFEDVIKQRTQ
jgi:hypothetical protein